MAKRQVNKSNATANIGFAHYGMLAKHILSMHHARKSRLHVPGAVCQVMACSLDHLSLFSSDTDRKWFAEHLGIYRERTARGMGNCQ